MCGKAIWCISIGCLLEFIAVLQLKPTDGKWNILFRISEINLAYVESIL